MEMNINLKLEWAWMDRFVTMTTKSALTTQWVLWESTLCHKCHIEAYWNDLSQHCVKKTIRRVMSIIWFYSFNCSQCQTLLERLPNLFWASSTSIWHFTDYINCFTLKIDILSGQPCSQVLFWQKTLKNTS